MRHLTLTLGSGGEPLISEADEDHDSMSMQVLTDLPQHDSTVLSSVARRPIQLRPPEAASLDIIFKHAKEFIKLPQAQEPSRSHHAIAGSAANGGGFLPLDSFKAWSTPRPSPWNSRPPSQGNPPCPWWRGNGETNLSRQAKGCVAAERDKLRRSRSE